MTDFEILCQDAHPCASCSVASVTISVDVLPYALAMSATTGTNLEGSWSIDAHRRALMLRRRCSACAEAVGPKVLFRGAPCPRCGQTSTWPMADDADSLIEAVQEKWRRRRVLIYTLVTVSTALTGFLPVVPTLIAVIFMIVLRHAFMREPLQWFSPGRRVVTGLNLKLWLVTVSGLTLGVNAILALLPFLNIVLNAAACLATTALFVEVALRYLGGRLRREASDGPSLELWEWGVPALLTGAIIGVGIAATGAVILVWDLISEFVP